MRTSEIKSYLENLNGQITFTYNGLDCGVDPLAVDEFDIWCGNEMTTMESVDEVLNVKFFDGKALSDILGDVTDVEY